MTNFLEETVDNIKQCGKTISDIVYIGNDPRYANIHYSCTWDEFVKLANVEYDSGYGAACIATDLIVMFSDGSYLERGEYDGSEWWSYVAPLTSYPTNTLPIARLSGGMWDTLSQMNSSDYEQWEIEDSDEEEDW